MQCKVAHSIPNFPNINPSRPEFHGLILPRHARGEIHDDIIDSDQITGIRMLRVYVPARELIDSPLPLIIVNDGHKAFEPARAQRESNAPWEQSGTLQLHRIMDGLICAGEVKPSIIVAIGPRASSRLDDFIPEREKISGTEIGGDGEQYLNFLCGDLLEIIYSKYGSIGLSHQASDRIVLGTSMAGFSALYAALKRPDIFGAALAMSPSAWTGDGYLSKLVQASSQSSAKLAIDIGHDEAENNKRYCAKLFLNLQARGWRYGHELLADFVPGAHNEDSWRARVPRLLKFLLQRDD